MGVAKPAPLYQYDEVLRLRSTAIRYVEGYLSAHQGEPDTPLIKDQLGKVLHQNPGNLCPDTLNQLYQNIREKERKVPALYFPYGYPQSRSPQLNYELGQSLLRELKVEAAEDQLQILKLGGQDIVSYSPRSGQRARVIADLKEPGLAGRLSLNPDFFTTYDVPKRKESASDIRNLAKAFFLVNGENHVALVQYLHPEGTTSEHYHLLEEIIVQLAGRSCLELRPVADDTQRRVIELSPGDIQFIQPEYLHRLFTLDEGSISVPIKKTDPTRSDHHYKEKSQRRLKIEVDELLQQHYNSGEEIISALVRYYQAHSPGEQHHLQTLFRQKQPLEPPKRERFFFNSALAQLNL